MHTINSPNLKIVECNPKSDKCLIAFSSNNPSQRNYFEFERICGSKRIKSFFHQIIFIRDPNSQFYINGFDDNYNNVNKIIDVLRDLTNNYIVYSIGYSSGGYMSVLISLCLDNVERVLSFGGVINILDWHGAYYNYNYSELDIVTNASENQKYFLNLLPFLGKNKTNIYAFYATNAKSDREIYDSIININANKFFLLRYNTSRHGSYCFSFDYKYLLTYSNERLSSLFNRFFGKTPSPLRFSLALQGPFLLLYNYIVKIMFKVRHKLMRDKP